MRVNLPDWALHCSDCGYGSDLGYGHGYISGHGYGFGSGDGCGHGYISGHGHGHGFGYGSGSGYKIELNGSAITIGCETHTPKVWIDRGDAIADRHGVGDERVFYRAIIERIAT